MNYPETFDEYPMRINAQAIRDTVAKYGEDEAVATVAIAIAGYANGKGVAFPGVDLIASQVDMTIQEVSRYAHRAAAIGIFTIRKVKAKGAKYAHNVYRVAKKFIRATADIRSSHFIANVKKWRAEGRDVAQAIKKRARKSLDDLTAKAEKMAQLFQERPELMDDPERAAQVADIGETPETLEIPAVSQPTEWESFGDAAPVAWEDGAQAGPTVGPASPAVQVQALQAQPPEPSRVFASWRDRVAAYREKPAAPTV